MKIVYTKKFTSEFKKLPKDIQFLAVEKEKIFKKNPFDPKLKTHKLIGKLSGNLYPGGWGGKEGNLFHIRLSDLAPF